MHRLGSQKGFASVLLCLATATSMFAAGSAKQSRTGYPISLNDGYGKALVFTGDFNGAHRTETLSYYTWTRDWYLRQFDGTRMKRVFVGNTSGFGDLADGRPLWTGGFSGNGQDEVLFYYPGDRNWWLGSIVNGQLTWKLVDNTTGFGQVWDGRPFYIGKFSRTDRTQILFYFPGDSNWWLGTFDGSSITWALAGNTRGFGNLNTGEPFLVDDFDGDGRTDVMFYAPCCYVWWLGTFSGSQLNWRLVGNTRGFGNVADGRPIWSGNFSGNSQAQVLFYFPGDKNWWLGNLASGQLGWKLVSNTTGFGQVGDGRPIYLGNFAKSNETEVLFFYPGDNNWWLASDASGTFQWSLAGNTAGFGEGFAGQVSSNVITGSFSGGLDVILYFSEFNQTLWLGKFSGSSLRWTLVDEPDPNPPSNLRITSVGPSSISLAWNDTGPAGDTDILVKLDRKAGAQGTYQEFASLSPGTSSLTDLPLALGVTYFYRARAVNVFAASDWSNEVSAKTAYPPPSIQFAANPSVIISGQSSTLQFTVTGATSVTIDHGIGGVPGTGTKVVSPTATTTYTLTATGPGGQASAQTTVTVTPQNTGGLSKLVVYNCAANPVHVWAFDQATNHWQELQGSPVRSGDDGNGTCPQYGAPSASLALADNHLYDIVAVDQAQCGANDPSNNSCIIWYIPTALPGNHNGPVLTEVVTH